VRAGGINGQIQGPNGTYSRLGPMWGGFSVLNSGAASGTWSGLNNLGLYNSPVTSAGTALGSDVTGVVYDTGFLMICSYFWSYDVPAPVWEGTFRAGAQPGQVVLTPHTDFPTAGILGWPLSTGCQAIFSYDAVDGEPVTITIDGCYGDCDLSGGLTVADFACFQTRFVGGDLYADCTENGQLTVADFACFQTQFVSGCP
jgi:hypothetical protein